MSTQKYDREEDPRGSRESTCLTKNGQEGGLVI